MTETSRRGAQYRFVFEASPNGIALLDHAARAEHCNTAFERLLGYSAAEMSTMPLLDLTSHGAAEADLFREVLAGRRDRFDLDKRHVHKMGRDVWTHLTVTAMRNDGGALEGIICTAVDISGARRLSEAGERLAEAARQSEERLGLALSAAEMGLWEWDLATDQISWSEGLERIAGLPPGGFGGTVSAFLKIVNPDDEAHGRAALQEAIDSGRDVFQAEYRFRRPDKTERYVLSRGRVLRVDGTPERVLGVDIDITSQRRLEEQFHHVQKIEAMGRLAGGVAHDFNNLLTAISGYGEFVVNNMSADDVRRPDMQEILDAADRAASLTRQLLAFSRRQVLAPRVINPNGVVSGMEKMLRRIIGSDIEMKVTLRPETGSVRVDPSQLEQVVLNLAVNARDAMPHGGVVAIETAPAMFDEPISEFGIVLPAGRYVMLSVGDTGLGMTPETKARLFEPFFTTKGEGRGTGLGLATVMGIVQQSGGAIWVDSSPGAGAIFKVYLPWVSQTAEPQATGRVAPASLEGTEVVFLVDDDQHMRVLGQRALSSHGYRVHTFALATEALAFLAVSPVRPDLLITDIVMPRMLGPELAMHARQFVPRLSVLYITGFTDRAMPGGVPDVLQKPFSPSVLLRKVRELLDRWLQD